MAPTAPEALTIRMPFDRTTMGLFGRYVAIGAAVFLVDVGTFQFLLGRGWNSVASVALSYAAGAVAHFLLNKYQNFRNFDRSGRRQVGTYIVLISLQWLLTIAIVSACAQFGIAPIVARMTAILVNLPVGFVAHRYLTFGQGIGAAVLRARQAWKR
jgi:putative flippase GtrA